MEKKEKKMNIKQKCIAKSAECRAIGENNRVNEGRDNRDTNVKVVECNNE